jgi:hypothetical protein
MNRCNTIHKLLYIIYLHQSHNFVFFSFGIRPKANRKMSIPVEMRMCEPRRIENTEGRTTSPRSISPAFGLLFNQNHIMHNIIIGALASS